MADEPATTEVPPLDLLLVARYGLLVSLTHLIPIPVLDWLVESALRRRLTRVQLHGFDVPATYREVGMLGSGDAGGCLGLLWSVVSWPFRRLLRYILWVLIIKAMIDTFSDVVARAILVHEACAIGALPGDAVAVRAAMQRAQQGQNTKPLERAVGIVYRNLRGQLWKLWRQGRSRMRTEARRARKDEAWTEADEAPLDEGLESVSEALARAIWVPEVHEAIRRRFRQELRRIPGDSPPIPDEDDEDSAVRPVELPDGDVTEPTGQPDTGGEPGADGSREDSEHSGDSDAPTPEDEPRGA